MANYQDNIYVLSIMQRMTILCLLVLTGCDLIYENNQRWLVTSLVSDQYHQPVANVPVTVIAANYSDRDIIGLNVTETNGMAKVRTIAPSNASEYIVEFNMLDQQGQRFDTTVSSLRMVAPLVDEDIGSILKNDFILDLGGIKVNQLASFVFRIENSSGRPDTLNWEIAAQPLHIEIDSVDFRPTTNVSVIKGQFLSVDNVQSNSLMVVDNDTLSIRYQFRNGSITSAGQQNIIMDSEDQTYVFQF